MVDVQTVTTLVKREMRDSLRDWRIVIPVLILTSLFPFLMNFTAQVMFNFLEQYGATLIGERLVPFGTMIVGFFPITFSLVIALETFVGEKERNSLEALLATPASDLELYLGKLIASLLLPVAASYVGVAVYLAFVSRSDLVQLPQMLLFQIMLLTTLEALVMVSGAVIVSSHTTSVRAANLLASFIIVPAALLLQVEAVFMFWAAYDALWFIALGLVVVDVILIRAGMRTFNREEILSREMDTLNLRLLARQVVRFWVAPPDQVMRAARSNEPLPRWSLGRFYTQHLPRLLQDSALAIGLALLVMLGGFVMGWGLAERYPLPPGMVNFEDTAARITRDQLADATPGWSLLPKFSPSAILSHNLRATALALLSALFSFGSLSLLLVGMPMAVVGFLAGQLGIGGENPWQFLLAFILPHGILELPATLLATAFALRIGASLIAPPERLTVGEGLLLSLVTFAKMFLFVVLPLLVAAALIEVYITPGIIRSLY